MLFGYFYEKILAMMATIGLHDNAEKCCQKPMIYWMVLKTRKKKNIYY